MFKFSKARGVLIAAILMAQPALAGLDKTVEKKGKTKPTKVESMARVPDKVAGNVLKCWQEGRLIFQRAGMDIGSDKLPGATKIQSAGKTVQVLDLKQGMCILDQSR